MTPETAMPRVATCLDLPAGSPGGSVELFCDLYAGSRPMITATAFMLQPSTGHPEPVEGLDLLTVHGKCVEGAGFWQYVDRLRRALTESLDPEQIDVAHLHHLAFGGAPALRAALPDHPKIAFVHGTDLLFAETYPDQLKVLKDVAANVEAIVVPTGAMADRLLQLAPAADRSRIHQIAWGVPGHLHTSPPARPQPDGPLRLLYAGRLTSEKGGSRLVEALAGAPDVHLSIAAPEHEFDALEPALDQSAVSFTYLGWLARQQLWEIFHEHDALVMPSTTLEAMGLVALEAQACGLPVIYQPVPGLRETLGASGLPADFTNPIDVAAALASFRNSAILRADLRAGGRVNAAQYTLSQTAAAITELGRKLIHSRQPVASTGPGNSLG